MPSLPTPPRTRSLWLLAAGLPLLFASGCPQLATDDFTKAAFDSGGSGGSGDGGTGGGGGTTPTIEITTAASSGGSETAASTSQGGTDPGSGGSEASTDADSSTSTTTSDATSDATTSDATTTSNTSSGATSGGDTCTEETEICDGLDNDCDGDVDPDDVCGWDAGCEGFAIDGRGYMFCGRPLGVDEATTRCADQGMTLVQIDSKEENQALVADADERWNSEGGSGGNSDGGNWGGTRSGGPGEEQQQPAFWTGGSDDDSEETWIWVGSGTAFWKGGVDGMSVGEAYTNWGIGRPNEANDTPENCAAVYFRMGADGPIGTWNDLECADGYPFICESP
ncbi:MAG TPA: C-type lectin domain-containing protein [Polyangiaceae bacterium]